MCREGVPLEVGPAVVGLGADDVDGRLHSQGLVCSHRESHVHVLTAPDTLYSGDSGGVLGIHRLFSRVALKSMRLNNPVEPMDAAIHRMLDTNTSKTAHATVTPPVEVWWPETRSPIQTRSMTSVDKDHTYCSAQNSSSSSDEHVLDVCEGSQLRLKCCQVLVPKLDIAVLKGSGSESSSTKTAGSVEGTELGNAKQGNEIVVLAVVVIYYWLFCDVPVTLLIIGEGNLMP